MVLCIHEVLLSGGNHSISCGFPWRKRGFPLHKLPKIEIDGPTTGPVLLRQGEPGTSQYITLCPYTNLGEVTFEQAEFFAIWHS